VAEGPAAARGDLTRLLGAELAPAATPQAPEPAADARFSLVGVVSPRSPQAAREGVALIAVDGNAPKAFRVGAVVDGTHVLQAVNARGASLGPAGGAPAITLNTVPPAPAATGQLPPAGAGAAPPLRMPSLTMPPQMPPGGSPAPMPVPPQVGGNPAALR
jgi:general secretion pathway protein C